ncbi:hypothetical protein GOV08_00690 [Candidatus Woesearchaeota archaeon]|nr:hypothetical protein [Candidatus Woesearchaeota archaeon]
MKKLFDFLNSIAKSNVLKIFSVTSRALEKLSKKIQKDLERAARKVRDAAVIFLLLLIGLFTLIIGFGFWIETRFYNLSGGRGFMLIGAGAFALAILYHLVTK